MPPTRGTPIEDEPKGEIPVIDGRLTQRRFICDGNSRRSTLPGNVFSNLIKVTG